MTRADAIDAMPSPEPDSSPDTGTTATVLRSLRQTVRMLRHLAEAHGLAEHVTREELDAAARHEEVVHAKAMGHPLVQAAKEYFFMTMPILRALRPLSLERGDESVIDAVETIEALAPIVASKVFRAISGSEDDDYDPLERQSDENGSAKVACIVIAESRDAWKVLMQLGRATADGVPAQLVRRLEEIDAGLAARFPRAMEFVRPGFDADDTLVEDAVGAGGRCA
jgi:hypothetical protein